MMRRVPCLDRMKQLIGYEPKTGLDEILRQVIAEKCEALSTSHGRS